MYPVLSYKIFVLDKDKLLTILNELIQQRKNYSNDVIYIGIYLEGLRNIRQDIFPYLIEFCKIYKINLILFDIPLPLRIHFHLENIPIKLGCAYIELF
ncbi:MAG: hypothetical protein KatS3mg129_0760 [Leptospiraceae bacterium]|nr:MAG: hypothetical protein KatS3mg129_0760 [Leptospiraceae bacterium]